MQHNTTNRALDPVQTALAYAQRGFTVIPLHTPHLRNGVASCSCGASHYEKPQRIGKHPRIREWPARATTNPDQILAWWDTWPDANIAIVTGSRSKLTILDIDPRNGGEQTLQALSQRYGALPVTPTVLTGGGGLHFYFRSVVDLHLTLGPGIDVLANLSHHAVAPPSLHASGLHYCWQEGRSLTDVPLAPLPDWIRDFSRRTVTPSASLTPLLPEDLPVVDPFTLPIPTRLKTILVTGQSPFQRYPSRSEAVFAAIHGLLDAGIDDDATIMALLRDPDNGISSKPREHGPLWVAREIARVRAKRQDQQA